MPTPGEILKALLSERKIKQSDLAARLRVKYLTVHRWQEGEGFTPANQSRVCRELGLDPEYFSAPDEAASREAVRANVFAAFRDTDIGRSMDDDEMVTLDRFRVYFAPPTVALYQSMLLGLRGLISRDQIQPAAEENEAIDQAARKAGQD